jgi:CRP/FNR family cyclic AMP-dependent transcriptional regulator
LRRHRSALLHPTKRVTGRRAIPRITATVEPIVGKFSQETLAEMIGTTRSRVSHFMNKFRKLGYIEYNGKLEIRNSLLNVVLYDKPEIRKHDASEEPS